jgi:hypothetical protein
VVTGEALMGIMKMERLDDFNAYTASTASEARAVR